MTYILNNFRTLSPFEEGDYKFLGYFSKNSLSKFKCFAFSEDQKCDNTFEHVDTFDHNTFKNGLYYLFVNINGDYC